MENYEGFLGPNPIHFSMQTYEGFGSGITVEGSYFDNAKQSPIVVYGKASGAKLVLCEISDDTEFDKVIVVGSKSPVNTTGCPFSLDVSGNGLTGTWTKGAIKYPVTLRKVASLDDTGDGKISGTVDIPFWAQTATDRFSGVYANTGSGICMEKMQVINKRSRKVDQEVRFSGCDAGMLMTPIYWNVQKWSDNGAEIISVNFRDGGNGYTMDYVFDPKTRKYHQKK